MRMDGSSKPQRQPRSVSTKGTGMCLCFCSDEDRGLVVQNCVRPCVCRSDEEASRLSKKKSRRAQLTIDQLKAQLDEQLKQSLTVRGVSSKYITSSNQPDLVDRLLNHKGHDAVIGLKRSSALEDLRKPSERSKKKAKAG
jgi:hypothetical protein